MRYTAIHYGLHLMFAVLLAYWLYPARWKQVSFLLLSTMLIDLDYLWQLFVEGGQVFDATRLSIGFHRLHTWPAIAIYVGMLAFRGPVQILGLGLLLYMVTDAVDGMFSMRLAGQVDLQDVM